MVGTVLEQRAAKPVMGQHAGESPEGGGMRFRFKITTGLLASIRADLGRPHAFAYERVGFILAAVAQSAWGVLVLAQEHHPVTDEDYLPDPSAGAMMGPEPIRKAMEWAFMKTVSIL